jgi:membrane associated rhomboid family serine protease
MIPLHDDNPTELAPVLTIGFIAVCVLVFFWQLSLDPDGQRAAFFAFGVVPAVLFDLRQLPPELDLIPPALSIVTSMFMHGGWMHIIGNMLFLWIFGNNVEDAMGHARFVLFYLICGIAAALAQAVPNPESTIPMVGASGAIAGVLGAYLLLYPHARVLVGVPLGFYLHTMRLKAGWVLGFWFAVQMISSLSAGDGPGVAWYAHLGGFVAGMALVPLFKRKGIRLFNPAHAQIRR